MQKVWTTWGNLHLFFQVAHKIGHSVKFLRNVFQDAQK
jgi:hypothetical protein